MPVAYWWSEMIEIRTQAIDDGQANIRFTWTKVVHQTTNDIVALFAHFVRRMENQTDEGSRVGSRENNNAPWSRIMATKRRLTSYPEYVMCHEAVRTVGRKLEYLEQWAGQVRARQWSMEDNSPAWLISRWNLSLVKICRLLSFNVPHKDASLLSRGEHWYWE